MICDIITTLSGISWICNHFVNVKRSTTHFVSTFRCSGDVWVPMSSQLELNLCLIQSSSNG